MQQAVTMKALSDRDRFIGTWTLVSQETHHADGRVTPSRGENPLGVIMYDAAGNMAVQLMRTDSRAVEYQDMTDAEAALKGYLGYFGRYDVDEAARVVHHYVVGASFFDYRGVTLTREYMFDGETLTLRAASGDTVRVLVWRRAAGS